MEKGYTTKVLKPEVKKMVDNNPTQKEIDEHARYCGLSHDQAEQDLKRKRKLNGTTS